ncbi:unnamed protein product [Phaeothamnion confervicola]
MLEYLVESFVEGFFHGFSSSSRRRGETGNETIGRRRFKFPSPNHVSRAKMLHEKDFVAIVSSLQDSTKSAHVHMEYLETIHSLSQVGSGNRRALAQAGVASAIVAVFATHSENAAVQRSCCRAVVAFAANEPENQRLMREAGAVETTVDALNSHRSDPLLAESALDAIRSLADDCLENQRAFATAGTCVAVAAALVAHGGIMRTAESACWALRSLASWPKNVRLLREAGAFESVVATLTYYCHGEHNAVLEAALGAIAKFALSGAERYHLRKIGACDAVLSMLRTNLSRSAVQGWSLAALGYMVVENPENRRALLDSGAADAVVAALNALPGDADNVQTWGLWAILMMASRDPESVGRLRQAGAETAIMAALANHPKHADVQEWGAAASDALLQFYLRPAEAPKV